jgi:hypothetical protein
MMAEFIFSQMRRQINASADRSSLPSSSENSATFGGVVLCPVAWARSVTGAEVSSCGIRNTPEK